MSLSNGNAQVSKNPRKQTAWAIVFNTIMDVIAFLSQSIGYILQSVYYYIVGFPKKDLNGEIALVTGGGNGLGRLIALRLTKLGVNVILWDISQDGIDETVKMIEELGGTAKGYIVDISNKEAVYKAAEVLRREVGAVSLLINNAGVVSGRPLLDTPDHMIERSFNVNILAHFWTTKAFLPEMIKRDHGHIVTIASLAGHVGISKLVDYCSSKFAAVGFDESLRLELESLGANGVHTTCICPYFIQATGMFDDVNSRWVPILNSNTVADRIVTAVQYYEKYVIIPNYLTILLAVRWMFPWGCEAGFLRRIVPDAAPQHNLTNGSPTQTKIDENVTNITNNNTTKGTPLLVHRVSLGERAL